MLDDFYSLDMILSIAWIDALCEGKEALADAITDAFVNIRDEENQ